MNWELFKELKQRRITQSEFAKMVGDHPSVVSRVVTGVWNLDPVRKEVYARTLGKKPEELFTQ